MPKITNIHGRWGDAHDSDTTGTSPMEFVKKEWQSVSCGLLLLFSLVSCQVAFSRFETISPYHLGYGYLAVLSVFVVSFFAYVIQTLSDYGFFADMRRFGSIFLGASSESSSEPIYIGQDSFFGVSGLPNYYAGWNLAILRDFYENNKHNRAVRIFVLHSEWNERYYERCKEQDIPPVSISSDSIEKIMNALQRLSVEPDTKRPEMVVIVEDNLLLAPYAKQMQAIIDGYSNGIRLICCGIELIDPNAHRIWQDDNWNVISTPIS